MPALVAGSGSAGGYPAGGATAPTTLEGGSVPFFYASNLYAQKFGTIDAFQLTTTSQEFQYNVQPGGFLRGVRLQVRSAGGVGGVATGDNPHNVFASTTLENVDGSEIIKPMNGYANYVRTRFTRPWDGDPARRYDFAAGINPSFSLFLKPELRMTAGVLANTDARSQFRVRYTLNTWANVITSGTTAPTVSVTKYAEIWAQPDSADLHGNVPEKLPPGLNLQTLSRHQILTLNAASSDNQFQLSLTGNEIRCAILIVRDSNNARQDYLSDPVRWYLDNRNLGVFSPDEIFNHMSDQYTSLQNGTSVRPTGVYVFPRFYNPGRMVGQSWLGTTNATYIAWESATVSTATNVPGTVEIILDEVIPVGNVPMELESI